MSRYGNRYQVHAYVTDELFERIIATQGKASMSEHVAELIEIGLNHAKTDVKTVLQTTSK